MNMLDGKVVLVVGAFDLCGNGGVLRRGDPETGRKPYPITDHGVNRTPHLWTWQKTGVHWYCSQPLPWNGCQSGSAGIHCAHSIMLWTTTRRAYGMFTRTK